MKQTKEILTEFHERVVNAIIAKHTKNIKKYLNSTVLIENAFKTMKKQLSQKLGSYFSSNNDQYQMDVQSFVDNSEEGIAYSLRYLANI